MHGEKYLNGSVRFQLSWAQTILRATHLSPNECRSNLLGTICGSILFGSKTVWVQQGSNQFESNRAQTSLSPTPLGLNLFGPNYLGPNQFGCKTFGIQHILGPSHFGHNTFWVQYWVNYPNLLYVYPNVRY